MGRIRRKVVEFSKRDIDHEHCGIYHQIEATASNPVPTMAGAANRCVIPEHKFDIERLTELLVADRKKIQPLLRLSGFGRSDVRKAETTDAFGHSKLGGIGDLVSEKLKEHSPKYNNGKMIDTINRKLGYLDRC